MKILLLNPNTTAEVTGLLHAAGSRAVSPGTELVPMTAQRGVPYIATRAEAQIGGAIALEMLAKAGSGFDAAVIAAFGDPGLFGARELFSFPVVGLAEAAMLTACMVGRKFAIVTFSRTLAPWYQECVAMHGLEAPRVSAGVGQIKPQPGQSPLRQCFGGIHSMRPSTSITMPWPAR